MSRGRLWILGVGLAPVALGACYAYEPIATTPAPGTRVALVLTDRGRVDGQTGLGPAVARVEGWLDDGADTAFVLRVAEVRNLGGVRTRWAGEVVSIPRDYVGNTLERRFSRGRTIAAGIALGGALVALIATRGLGVFGGGDDVPGRPPDDGGGTTQVVRP